MSDCVSLADDDVYNAPESTGAFLYTVLTPLRMLAHFATIEGTWNSYERL